MNQLGQLIDRRGNADDVSMDAVQLVMNAVAGDPTEGPDSPLIERMGRTRKSERKTGLTRKKKTPGKE